MLTLTPSRIDLPADVREKTVTLLNDMLASTLDLYSQVKYAHWNVKGSHFFQLHELFDNVAEPLIGFVDELAERITALGGVAQGTVRQAAENSILPEYTLGKLDGNAHVQVVADHLAAYASHIRLGIQQTADWGDAGTSDLLTGISREVDKKLWFVESHLH